MKFDKHAFYRGLIAALIVAAFILSHLAALNLGRSQVAEERDAELLNLRSITIMTTNGRLRLVDDASGEVLDTVNLIEVKDKGVIIRLVNGARR